MFAYSIDNKPSSFALCPISHPEFFDLCPQKRRERGRIAIKGVRLVEPAVLNNDGGDSSAPDVSISTTAHKNIVNV